MKSNVQNIFYLCYSPTSASDMSGFIGDVMKKKLMDFINSRTTPLGLIIDGTVSDSNVHFVIMLFQVLQNNSPTTHFYRVCLYLCHCIHWFEYLCCHFAFPFQFIELKKKADAETISSEIIKAMTDDGIHDAVAKDLVSFTTDGMFHIG